MPPMVKHEGYIQIEFHTPKDQFVIEDMFIINGRSINSNLLTTNNSEKLAECYGGKLKWTISTYPNILYSDDLGFIYLFKNFFIGLKDLILDTYAIAQRIGLTRPPIIALGIVLSPILILLYLLMMTAMIFLAIILYPFIFMISVFISWLMVDIMVCRKVVYLNILFDKPLTKLENKLFLKLNIKCEKLKK
ncbi:hypothetical protein Mgra_00005548 [Meloidogyne graminicola]|uniref:Uncharacterized protein n=1 Tax=Meloidogyne graminicola TaxID=189291 RepID=A0A8S9ZNL3_9BILA|nr:hypothetical protein Mgra_00005548 [Meloidogyne graminicola]